MTSRISRSPTWNTIQRQRERQRQQRRIIGVGNAVDCSEPIAHQALSFDGKKAKIKTVFTEPALCASFYENKTEPDSVCQMCLRQSRALDTDCPCDYNNFCQFARCVNSESKKCKQTYDMIFNTKHKPFQMKDIKGCQIDEKENFSNPSTWKPWQWIFLIVFFYVIVTAWMD